ncbi:MAG TPA: hypothetical protein ENN06_09875 [Desulfobacteraceae bacterium]|nr:hypothetical protein [Desulfobacteraceae bacterium]
MSNQENRPSPRRREKPSPLRPVLIFFVLLVLTIGAALLFFPPGDRQLSEPEHPAPPAVETPLLPQEPPDESAAVPDGEFMPTPEADVAEPEAAQPSEEEILADRCAALAGRLNGFFDHLDKREYIQTFNLEKPSREYFIALSYRLLDNPPVVSRESDDLYTILKNMAHFFRIIGKDNIVLIKTILDRERDKIEDVAADIYFWSTIEGCDRGLFGFSPELAEMYEYAGFFLNTMGGRSYLFRRDSRSRLVVNYYSVLLLDLANEKGINRHGLDIAQVLPQLVEEVESSNKLIYKENYLDRLYSLLEKYP